MKAKTKNCTVPLLTPRTNLKKTIGFRDSFRICAQWIALALGSPLAFLVATASVVVWGITGPAFDFSNTWQLVINTTTTIITFLMVFLIQNTQNRDTRAMQLKLDELLRGLEGARSNLIKLENLSDDEIDRLQREFERLKTRSDTSPAQPGTKRAKSNRHNGCGTHSSSAKNK